MPPDHGPWRSTAHRGGAPLSGGPRGGLPAFAAAPHAARRGAASLAKRGARADRAPRVARGAVGAVGWAAGVGAKGWRTASQAAAATCSQEGGPVAQG